MAQNSYTSEQLNSMMSDAIRRAKIMHSRAERFNSQAEKAPNRQESDNSQKAERQPQNAQGRNNNNIRRDGFNQNANSKNNRAFSGSNTEANKRQKAEQKAAQKEKDDGKSDGFDLKGILDFANVLGIDKDRLIILVLIMLLSSQKENLYTVLALLYIAL